ncbi:MAG: ATP synthase F1 subunit delta [Bacteroidia bacterium]
MVNTKVASRYAKSLLELAQETQSLEKSNEDLNLIQKVMNENKSLESLMKNPIVKSDKKLAIIRQIFKGKVSEITMLFLEILIKKRREAYLKDAIQQFIAQYKEIKGITTAMITTAVGIDDKIRREVIDLVKGNSDSKIELEEKINPELIGGFVLRYGNIQYDTTVAKYLRQLKRNFSKNLYIGKIKNK